MSEADCDIIRDLLPLYTDGLTSQGSNQLVEEHLSHCGRCAELCRTLSTEAEFSEGDAAEEIDYLKKVKKKHKKAVVLALMLCLALFLGSSAIGTKVYLIGFPLMPSSLTYSCKFDEVTGELKIKGNVNGLSAIISGVKVESDLAFGNTINVTVMGAKPLPWNKAAHTQFYKTIPIPDDGQRWSVYLTGAGKLDREMVWDNRLELEGSHASS